MFSCGIYLHSCTVSDNDELKTSVHFVFVVVIWSNSMGDIHMWQGPIHWDQCHESSNGTTERTEAGET